MSLPIAIVGGGLAGLAAARELHAAGRAVVVFDKGRAAGGRCATRRHAPFAFDHGAQFFTVREPVFAAALAPLGDRLVRRWAGPFRTWRDGVLGPDPRPGERYVAVPGMSALRRAFAEPLGQGVRAGLRVEGLRRDGDGWWLSLRRLADDELFADGPFAAVVLTLPPPQASALLATAAIAGPVAQRLDELSASLQPCLAAMVAFGEPLAGGAEWRSVGDDRTGSDERGLGGVDAGSRGAGPVAGGGGAWFVTDDVLGFAAHDGGKPGRDGAPTYVLHGAAAWSSSQFEQPLEASFDALLAAFARIVGKRLPPLVHRGMHRWRYALAAPPAPGPTAVFDRDLQLAAAGDAFVGGRVEGAFLSGVAAARLVLAG